MVDKNEVRIAWLVPSAEFGAYWPPVLHELKKLIPNTIFYTGRLWPRYDPEAPGTEVVEVVGDTQFITTQEIETGYSRGYIKATPGIIFPLLKFKPQVIFASGFSIWTLVAIIFKPIGKWRLVLVYESSSPNVDFRDSKVRSTIRRWMGKFADTFVSNSRRGKEYLVEVIGAAESNIFAKPYMVPDAQALVQKLENNKSVSLSFPHPIFLCVGQVISRKGIKNLLEACTILQSQGYSNYTVIIVGDGEQRPELEALTKEWGLEKQIVWTGWIEYGYLGSYFLEADVFVFPTLEDTWGMVVLEAMAFGKPILCSKWAGACEMIVEGENGYIFDPYQSEGIANAMRDLIDCPEKLVFMGQKSQQLIAEHTPEEAAKLIADVTSLVLEKI
jgi:glycosyltransferase involved in cell wall biosynthesis